MLKYLIHSPILRKGLAVGTLAFIMVISIMTFHVDGRGLSSISYLGNYPSDKWGSWTERLQGVGNNQDSWFFTQMGVLWKVPLSINLNNTKKMSPGRSFPGVLRVGMPEELKRLGFNHFGDLDVANGYIFIPIERSPNQTAVIAVFREHDLSFVSYAFLPNRTRSGWCSIAPNGWLFTSHNKIDSNNPIYVYEIDWNSLRNYGRLNLRLVRNFYLTRIPQEYGGDLSEYMQGGDFSTDGRYLFLMNGRTVAGHETHDRGIWVFRNENYERGVFVTKSSQNGQNLRYEYKPGLFEEPEGITYWDIDSQDPHGKGGQLHAILLKIRSGDDSIWLKHYRLNYQN